MSRHWHGIDYGLAASVFFVAESRLLIFLGWQQCQWDGICNNLKEES
jgi:hypothetical protein